MNMEKKKLRINCGLALLLNDRENMLDTYDNVAINSGTVIVSSIINAKLSAKGAKINCGNLRIEDIKGKILQLDKGAIIDGSANLDNLFIVSKDDIIITKAGLQSLGSIEGMISAGKVYYPQSADLASLLKISGEKQAYPDDAHVMLGNHDLEGLVFSLDGKINHVWISGRLKVLERKSLEYIKSRGLKISCLKLITFQGLNEEFGNLINCPDRVIVPDGYEITGKIQGNELALYGPKIYVDGKFFMDEKDIPALHDLESIIVKAKASLPASAVKIFKTKGRADDYFIFEGRLVEINGFEQYSHDQLQTTMKNSGKLTVQVNGCLLFDKDVTPEDVECIASLSYNGTVIASGAVKNALAAKVKTGNGFMGDPEMFANMTGQDINSLFKNKTHDDSHGSGVTAINLGTYILA